MSVHDLTEDDALSTTIWKEACEWVRTQQFREGMVITLHFPRHVRSTKEVSKVFAEGIDAAGDLWPATQYDGWIAQFKISAEDALARDWYMIGRDLFHAVVRFREDDPEISGSAHVDSAEPESAAATG